MKLFLKYVRSLIILEILTLLTGFLIISIFSTGLHLGEIAILSIAFTLIALITLVIFFKGQTKEPGSQTMHTLVSLSLKFLIELVLAVLWFYIAKKTRLSSVILFFVLYLTFTLFPVFIMRKTLNNKSL